MTKIKPIFFMHIPKTGGTTLRHMLYNYYSPQEVFPNQKQLRTKFSNKYPKPDEFVELVNSNSFQNKIICGHYTFDILSQLDQDYQTITMVRNPLNRFMSHLGHIQREREYEDINDFFDTDWVSILRTQSRFFNLVSHSPDWKKIDDIIENISFIGINEQFPLSIKLLNTILDTDIKILRSSKNKTKNKITYEMLTSKNQSQVIRYLGAEIIIYNKCLQKFNQEIRKYDITI